MLSHDDFHEGFSKALFDPRLRRAQCEFLILQLLGQSGDEVWLLRDGFGFEMPQHPGEDLGAGARTVCQAIRPQVCRIPGSCWPRLTRVASSVNSSISAMRRNSGKA